MKKLSIAFICLLFAFNADKNTVELKMPIAKLNYHWQTLNEIKATIDNSNLPHQQVKAITQAIDSLQKDLRSSIVIDTTKKK